jgi:hypothetical protein
MTIDFIVTFIRVLFNKYRRGLFKLADVTTAIEAAQLEFYNEHLKMYRESNNNVIPQPIKKFVSSPSQITLINGVGSVPANFTKEITFTTDAGYEGECLHPEEFDDRKRSLILPPTSEQPILKVVDGKVYVEPASVDKIFLTYFRTPNAFVYATTTDGDGRGYTFNAGGSTDIEFGREYAVDIAKRACVYLGIGYQNPDVAQIANA